MVIAGSGKSRKILLSTQNTDDQTGWLELLSSLTDDELQRYGEIAADQRRLEWQYGWAQVVSHHLARWRPELGSCATCMGNGLTLARRRHSSDWQLRLDTGRTARLWCGIYGANIVGRWRAKRRSAVPLQNT